jgi:hypothetical protein
MEYLVLAGVIIVVLFLCNAVNNSQKNKRLSQISQPSSTNTNRQPYQTLTEQINWNENNDLANQLTWVELPSTAPVNRRSFLDSNTPDDIENILSDVIGTKDPYTQERFEARQRVYLCRVHRLAYHEDTWTAIERKCLHCSNADHTTLYVLPTERSS